jgi:hypothetical protein
VCFSVRESVLTMLLILGIYLYSLHLSNLLQILGRYDGKLRQSVSAFALDDYVFFAPMGKPLTLDFRFMEIRDFVNLCFELDFFPLYKYASFLIKTISQNQCEVLILLFLCRCTLACLTACWLQKSFPRNTGTGARYTIPLFLISCLVIC